MDSHHHPPHLIDTDPCSTVILEELLRSSEWDGVEEIVKLTFRAFADLVNIHSHCVRDIKSILTTRASKQQLVGGLALKVNLADFKNTLQSSSNSLHAEINQTQTVFNKKLANFCTTNEFTQLLSIVEAKANSSEVNEALQNKISKQTFITGLQKKANKQQIECMLNKKADTTDLQFITQSLESKVTLSTLEKLTQVIQNKADRSDLALLSHERVQKSRRRENEINISEQMDLLRHTMGAQLRQKTRLLQQSLRGISQTIVTLKRQLTNELSQSINMTAFEGKQQTNKLKCQVQEQFKSIKNVIKNLQQQLQVRLNTDVLMSELNKECSLRKRSEQEIYREIDDVRRRTEEVAAAAMDRREIIDFKTEMMEKMDNKIETEHVQVAFDKFQAQVNARVVQDYDKLVQMHQSIHDAINAHDVELAQLKRILCRKVQKQQYLLTQESLKRTRKTVEDCRSTVDTVYGQLQHKLSHKEYEVDLIQTKRRLDSLGKLTEEKAFIKDVCALIDSKPNIDDVNKALLQLSAAVEQRVAVADLQQMMQEQATVNQTLCLEAVTGRWMWHSGDLKAGGLVPWEIECANTVPDHFFWERDKTSILILAAGIYEITCCTFAPAYALTLLVNGDAVGVGGCKNQENISGNSKKLKKKKDKECKGCYVREYLLLPARSRVSVSASDSGEGFLNIRRL